MIGRLTRPSRDAAAFADAQSLLEAGLDREFVLGLFSPEERAAIAPLLGIADETVIAYEASTPRPAFEQRLRARVLAHGRSAAAVRPAVAPPTPANPRTAIAAGAMAAAAMVGGVLAAGVLTAEDAAPGDWNYTLKLAGERLQYNLSGDRINVQLRHTEARVRELEQRLESGDANDDDIARLRDEWSELSDLVTNHTLDAAQQERLKALAGKNAEVVARAREGGVAPAVADDTIRAADNVVAAGTGGTPITPSPAAPTPEATATASATEAATPSPEASPTAQQ